MSRYIAAIVAAGFGAVSAAAVVAAAFHVDRNNSRESVVNLIDQVRTLRCPDPRCNNYGDVFKYTAPGQLPVAHPCSVCEQRAEVLARAAAHLPEGHRSPLHPVQRTGESLRLRSRIGSVSSTSSIPAPVREPAQGFWFDCPVHGGTCAVTQQRDGIWRFACDECIEGFGDE